MADEVARDRAARALLRACFDAAVGAAQPAQVLAPHLPPPPRGRTVVVGAGKAAGAMARALDALWPATAPLSGLVVTRDGHVPPPQDHARQPARIEIIEAAHPVPDARSAAAGAQLLAQVGGLGPDDLVIALISGGGSALALTPVPELGTSADALYELQRIVTGLLHSGAPIAAMNTVRRHLSAVHGGRLALACGPAPVLSLLISDVPGDDPATIASGPTVADPSSCGDALAVLDGQGVAISERLRAALESGALETPKAADLAARRHDRVVLVATPWQSLQAAAQCARAQGWNVHVLGDALEGPARTLGALHVDLALASAQGRGAFAAPCLLLSGGEATVSLPPHARGQGGRAGEFALGMLARLRELGRTLPAQVPLWCLAADTDGIDGVSAHAGAVVAPDSLARLATLGTPTLDAALLEHDSHGLFAALGDLVSTGPTHTNVNDFRAVLVWA